MVLIDTDTVRITLAGLITAVVIVVIVIVVSHLVRRHITRFVTPRQGAAAAGIYAASRVIQYTIVTVGVLFALGIAGVPLTQLSLLAGAIGVGVGFGLQSIFANFVSGLILLFDRSLKVGDFVELPTGFQGEVLDIRMRATYVRTNDNVDLLVPNSEFINGTVINWTYSEAARRVHIPFGVAYGTDKELVREAALAAADELPFSQTDDPERCAQVWLTAMGESSLDFELVVWLTPQATKRPRVVEAAYTWALHTALVERGIEIPFPQRDLHLRSAFGLGESAALAAFGGSVADADAGSASTATADVHGPARVTPDNDARSDAERAIRDDERRQAQREAEASGEGNTPDT